MDRLCQGRILGPTDTLNPVCRQLCIGAMRSGVILPFASSILSTLCRNSSAIGLLSGSGATVNAPFS